MTRARSQNKGFPHWARLLTSSVILTLLVYGASLSLPFFFDDFVHYPFVEKHTFWQIWQTTDELAYYRPFNFALWRITYVLMETHNRIVDHGLNLLLHAANGIMTGWLAAQLWQSPDERPDWLRGYLSAALYLLYPFSYQVVPWVGSMSHLLVTNLILLSLIGYWQMRQTRQCRWGVFSLVGMLLALLTHENGILVLPFLLFIELTTPAQKLLLKRLFSVALIWALPILIWLPLRWTIHQSIGGSFFPNNWEGLWQNSAYFVQGAAFPLTGLGGWIHRRFGFNDLKIIWILSGCAFGAATIIQWRAGANRRSWLPWLWWLTASVPAILLLKVNYVINGPRLLMVASVGAAWLWADVLVSLARLRGAVSWRRRSKMAALLFLVLIVWQNLVFIRERMRLYQILGANFNQLITLTQQANAAGETAVFINAPSWLAPRQTSFALGHEGVLFWPDYVPPPLLVKTHTGETADIQFARVDAIRPDTEFYYYGVSGGAPYWDEMIKRPTRLFAANYEDRAVTMELIGAFQPETEGNGRILATFASETPHAVILHDAAVQPVARGFEVRLVWSVMAPHPEATVFVHLVDGNGQLVAQADGAPLAGSYPFSMWAVGRRVEDIRQVYTETQPVAAWVGLYNPLTGERETAVSPTGELLPDGAVTIFFE